MSETVQFVVVMFIVVGAVGVVTRRAWRKQRGQAPACGSCDSCQRKSG
ncbi:MAG: FeoB-associated Cys-rich membrane protein [Hydrogenophaga sp.]